MFLVKVPSCLRGCLPGWSQCHSSAAPGVPPRTPSPALRGWGGFGGAGTSPVALNAHACRLSVCPAVCEGNFTCKENEVCVRPGECRCRHGYFGANCDTSEYQWAPTCPRWGSPGCPWGDFPEQSIKDGAADAFALPLPVPLALSPGHRPFGGVSSEIQGTGRMGGGGNYGREVLLGWGVSTGAQWWGCPPGSAGADGSARRVSPAVLGSRLQGDVQLPPQRAMRGRDGPVHLQPQPLGSQMRERLPLQARQVRPEDGQMHLRAQLVGSPVLQLLLLQPQLPVRPADGQLPVPARLVGPRLQQPVLLQQLALRAVHRALPVPGADVRAPL